MKGIKNYNSVIDSIKVIDDSIAVKQAGKPSLGSAIIAAEFMNPNIIGNFICSKESKSFNLCGIEYDHIMPYTRVSSITPNTDRSAYWIGIINTKLFYPHTFIRQELLWERFVNLFTHVDIRLPNSDSFNLKYFVSCENPDKLISTLSRSFIDYAEKLNRAEIELNNSTCYFRLDAKPITKEQTESYLETGFKLVEML